MFFARTRRTPAHPSDPAAQAASVGPTSAPEPAPGIDSTRHPEPSRWGLVEGEDIASGLTVVRLLGGGASYEAYLAFDEHTHGPVVVKVLRPELVSDDAALRGLRREVEALATINHPVVVRGLREDVDASRPHVVLECIDGPRLSSLIRRHGPLTESQYLPLAVDLASALHYLGRIGWTHLDIKPSNVIMGAPARLIDLSVARPERDAAGLRHVIGTDAYLAPEQAAPGEFGVPGPASDVWGLGSTLFHAVAGYRPFPEGDPRSDDPARSHPQTVTDPKALPPRTPPAVVEVIGAMLHREPSQRPAPAEVSHALQPVLAAQPAARLTFKVR